MAVGPILYQKAVENGMIAQFKELRINVKNSRDLQDDPSISPSFISGTMNGILRALGNEMDRQEGINNLADQRTGPIAYNETKKIGNLIENIKKICAEVNPEKHYSGMLRELAKYITLHHGEFGDK